MRTIESLERALSGSLRLAPYGLPATEVSRIREMADDGWKPPKESEARNRALGK